MYNRNGLFALLACVCLFASVEPVNAQADETTGILFYLPIQFESAGFGCNQSTLESQIVSGRRACQGVECFPASAGNTQQQPVPAD